MDGDGAAVKTMTVVAFVAMIGVFALLAARPQIRHEIRWGRTAERSPVSVAGYYGFLAGGFLILVSPFAAEYFGSTGWILLAFAGVAVFICAGLGDRLRSSKEGSKGKHKPTGGG